MNWSGVRRVADAHNINWWLKYAFKGLTLMDIVIKYMMGHSKNPTTRLYYWKTQTYLAGLRGGGRPGQAEDGGAPSSNYRNIFIIVSGSTTEVVGIRFATNALRPNATLHNNTIESLPLLRYLLLHCIKVEQYKLHNIHPTTKS